MSRVFLLSVLLVCAAPILLFPSTLSNEHLVATVDEGTGRLTLAIRNGPEQGIGVENRHLLFYDQPPSSYTLIYVDDNLFMFGSDEGSFIKRPVIIGNYIETVWGNSFIRVTQVVQFVQRETTGVEDGIMLSYEVQNRTSRNMEVGLRILHDTFLGEKSSSHFVLSDGTLLEHEAAYDSVALPAAWISRAEASSSEVSQGEASEIEDGEGYCLRGVLEGRLLTTPSRIVFANYRSLYQQPVQYKIMDNKRFHNLPYSRNDSAVALYYGPELLEPAEEVQFSTILGLCGEGDYVLGGQEVVYEEKTVAPLPVVVPLAEREDVEQLIRDIGEIEMLRVSMEQLNALIDELNSALEGGEVTITEERLAEIRQALKDMAEQ
jgi:hypothetical protein